VTEPQPAEHLNLPAVTPGGEVEADVIDGEVVVDAAVVPPRRPVYVLHVITRHPLPRATVRHAGYVPAGVVVAWRRWRHARQRPERMMQQAETAGDHAQVIAWRQQLEQEKQNRHGRIVKSAETVMALARNSLLIFAVGFGLMLVLSILLSLKEGLRGFIWPWETAAEIAVWAVSLLAVGWVVLVLGFAGTVLGVLHELGRRPSPLAPGWSTAAKPEEEDHGLVVTADTIVLALQNTPVSELKKKFKEGWQPAFHTLPVRDGLGYFAVFSLPMGVTASMLADQVEVFARNIHRAKCETWITDAERAKVAPAGYVSLYVLNPGVLDRPTPEYPLMHDGQADVFTGVPGGTVARGDEAVIPVMANNAVWGGQMGMGKSNAGRVYILGCCTDPLCEVEVFVFAGNGDYDAYAPRLALYVKGTDDAVAAAAVQRLYELLDETGRREGRLAGLGAKKLTRRIAEQHSDMRPLVALFSECHELFGHPEYGELAAELAVKVIKRARKTGITLCFDTQSSRAAAIPPALVELVSVNVCFYVKTWRSNDGFLGDGSFQGGIRATELRPNRDIGRSVVTGISDAQFELLKWYLIDIDDDTGWDAATEVIARCMRDLAPGTRVSGGDGASLPVIAERDLLTDLAMVIDGPWRVSVNELPHRLKQLDRTWPEYRSLTGRQLRARLTDLGVKTTNTDNKPELDPAELHRVISERERVSELP